jgi:hypothetical protein
LTALVNALPAGSFDPVADHARMPERTVGTNAKSPAFADANAAYAAFRDAASKFKDAADRDGWIIDAETAIQGGDATAIVGRMKKAADTLSAAMQASRRFRALLLLPYCQTAIAIAVTANPKLTTGSLWQPVAEAAYKAVSADITKAIDANKGLPVSEEEARAFIDKRVSDYLTDKVAPATSETSTEDQIKNAVEGIFSRIKKLEKLGRLTATQRAEIEAHLAGHGIKAAVATGDTAKDEQRAKLEEAKAREAQAKAENAAPITTDPAPTATDADHDAAANVVANAEENAAPVSVAERARIARSKVAKS